jgi:O-acetyl-ADP-ribose deacetylase (regulator of RNase III)
MFKFRADIRINTVNCVGVMGKGVALAFKRRSPQMFSEYAEACKKKEVVPGKLHVWKDPVTSEITVNFPTKRHWRNNSRYEDIEEGLLALKEFLTKYPKATVTLPALGCGHGGLDWPRVYSMIREHLDKVDCEILVFQPTDSLIINER